MNLKPNSQFSQYRPVWIRAAAASGREIEQAEVTEILKQTLEAPA